MIAKNKFNSLLRHLLKNLMYVNNNDLLRNPNMTYMGFTTE